MSGSSPSLRELIDIDELQSIQDSFARAAGISSVILSPEGDPLTKFTDPTGFCSLIQSTGKGKERCFRSFVEMGEIALLSETPEICYCFAHGGHFVAPIMIDGEHKGTMFAGQFIPEKFSSEQLHDLEEIASEIGIDQGLLRKEAGKMRVVGEDVIRNYSSLLFKIVETIARRGAQAAELSRVNDALQVAHDELEKRVQERTAELAEANKGLKHEITERKLAEEALQKEKDGAQHYLDVAGVMFLVIGADRKVSLINKKGCEILGYEEEGEITGKDWFNNFIPERLRDEVARVFGSLMAGEIEPVEYYENPVLTKHAEERIVAWHNTLLKDEHGRIYATLASGEDITERKRAEEELIKSEKLYKEAQAHAHIAHWDYEPYKENLFWSDELYSIFEIDKDAGAVSIEDFIGRIHPEDRDTIREQVEKGESYRSDYRIVMDNGSVKHIHEEVIIARQEDGKVVQMRGTAQDITERKKAENALRGSEEKYRLLADNTADCIWQMNPDFEFTYVNPSVLQMLGFTQDEWVGSSLSEHCSPEDMEFASDLAKKELKKGPEQGGITFEMQLLHKNGKVVTAEISSKILFDEDGNPVGLQGSTRDITERKASEEELKETTELLQSVMDNATDEAIVATDRIGTILNWNEGARRLLGYEPEEVVGRKSVRILHTEEYLKSGIMDVNIKKMIATGKPLTEELNYVAKDGRAIPVQQIVNTRFDEDGEFVGMVGMARDITEQKRIEKALNDRIHFEKIVTAISTSFINLAPDEIDAGIEDALGRIGEFSGVDRSYLFRFTDTKTTMDNTHEWCARGIVPQIGNLKGLQTADFPWLMPQLNRFEVVHIPVVADLPPDADATKEILQSQDILSVILVPMVYGGTLIGYLGFDSVRQEKRWSEDNIALLKIVGAIFMNALERMRVMDALRSSETKFHAIFEENPLGATIIDKDRKIREVNDAAAALIGRPRKEIIGRICHEFIGPKAQNDCPIYDRGLTYRHEDAILLSKDRGEVPIRKTVTQITIDGEPVLLEVFYDVTKRKAMENALRESEEKYRTIYDSSKDAIMTLAPEEGFLSGNSATIEMFGCKDENDFISRTPYDLSPQHQPDGKLSSEKAKQMMVIAMKKGSHLFEWTHKRMDGKEFPTTVLLTGMELQGRRVLQATVRDISEQKKAEEELQERMKELETFYRATLGREDRVIELKQEVNELSEQLGKKKKYRDYSKQLKVE